jgi:hypothetical protein
VSRLVAGCAAAVIAIAVAVVATQAETGEPAAAKAPAGFFGVVPQGPLAAEDFQRMGEGQVGRLRILVSWGTVDPTSGESDYHFDDVDQLVLGAAENGIEVLPFLYGTPVWVATELDGQDCDPDCATYAPRSEEALAAWEDFVGALVDRYGPDGELWERNPQVEPVPVRAWQIWNEQNSQTFYMPEPDVEGYTAMLDRSADAIRERDPEATVVLGGMFGTPFNGELPSYTAWDYLRLLYEAGADQSFDAVAAHPYAANLEKVESQVKLMSDEVDRAGDDDASMWITEVGWASSGPEVPLNRGEDGQAQQLSDMFQLFLDKREKWRIETVTWYSWRDIAESICDWCAGSGLFAEASLDPKPAWDAFVSFTGGE